MTPVDADNAASGRDNRVGATIRKGSKLTAGVTHGRLSNKLQARSARTRAKHISDCDAVHFTYGVVKEKKRNVNYQFLWHPSFMGTKTNSQLQATRSGLESNLVIIFGSGLVNEYV